VAGIYRISNYKIKNAYGIFQIPIIYGANMAAVRNFENGTTLTHLGKGMII